MTKSQWRHNDGDGVSNHQPHDCLLNRLFKVQIKENIKDPRHWPLWGEFTGDRWIPLTKGQWRGNASIWWRHHGLNGNVIWLLVWDPQSNVTPVAASVLSKCLPNFKTAATFNHPNLGFQILLLDPQIKHISVALVTRGTKMLNYFEKINVLVVCIASLHSNDVESQNSAQRKTLRTRRSIKVNTVRADALATQNARSSSTKDIRNILCPTEKCFAAFYKWLLCTSQNAKAT